MIHLKDYIIIDLSDDRQNIIRVTCGGKVIEDTTAVIYRKDNSQILGCGKNYNRPPGVDSVLVYAIQKGGFIADFQSAKYLFKHLINRVLDNNKFLFLRYITVEVFVKGPLGAVERRAMVDALKSVGGKKILIHEEITEEIGGKSCRV